MKIDKFKKIEFTVHGMTGMGGEPKVLKALEGLQGVEKVVFSYAERKATVTYNNESIDFNQMKKALLGVGYVAVAENNPNIQNNVGTKPTGKPEFQAEDLVCYCFKYTKKDIEQDYIKNNHSTIMAKIAAEKKAGGCDCATKNPKGRGCLADVHQVVDKLKGKNSFNVINGKTGDRRDFWMQHKQQTTNIITLDNSIEPLQERFNTESEKIRFIALLSPTCPLGRDKGARAVHATLSEKFPNVRLCALIVWIPILEKDSLEEALPSVGIMNDRRFRHYYDPNQIVGKTIANSVGWIEKVAWDIYLFYRPGTPWDKYSPKPSYWMHQLTDEWVKDDKYRTGDDLKNELVKSMESLLA